MLSRAFAYKRWSDERTLDAVRRIDASTFPDAVAFARQQFNHIVIVEELFRSRLEGAAPPHAATNSEDVPTLAEIAFRLESSFDWYADFVAGSPDLPARIGFEFADGRRGAMSVEEMLFHVLTHGAYHRGNIARALDLAEVLHPVDGYAAFIHEREPERRDA